MIRGAAQVLSCRASAGLHAGSVNYVAGFQFAGAGDGREAHRNAADVVAFLLNGAAAFSGDGSGHARAENQIIVRGVDNSVGVHLREVALLDDDTFLERLRT